MRYCLKKTIVCRQKMDTGIWRATVSPFFAVTIFLLQDIQVSNETILHSMLVLEIRSVYFIYSSNKCSGQEYFWVYSYLIV